MKKQTTNDQLNHQVSRGAQFKAGSPTFFSPYEARFSDPEKAREVLAAVANFFEIQKTKNERGRSLKFLGFTIERTYIKTSKNITKLKMKTDFGTGSVVLYIPRIDGETDLEFFHRELKVLTDFSSSIHESHIRSAWEFFWSLDDTGKSILLSDYKTGQNKNG